MDDRQVPRGTSGAGLNAVEFASHIQGVKRTGQEHTGRCPSHDDQRASLSWRDGEKGLIVTCFAGCTVQAITAALGVPLTALFADGSQPFKPQIVKAYDYCDEAGTLLYQVLRMLPKDFRQRQPDGKGDWIRNITKPPVRRVLYRLKELQGEQEVKIVEGEKDADRLWALGVPATTNSGGAGKWVDEYSAILVASGVLRVVVIPDNDPPGEAHAKTVADSCRAAGLLVTLLPLPGLALKGDVSDWLDAGHTAKDLQRLMTDISTVKDPDRIVWMADAVRDYVDSLDKGAPSFIPTPFPDLNKLLCGGIEYGELYYLAAKGGEGKSALAIELARYVSNSEHTLVVSQEMGLAAIVRRFMAQESGVSATRLRQHNLLPTDWTRISKAASDLSERKLGLSSNGTTVKKIRALVRQAPEIKLVIVDYLQLLRGDGKDSRAQLEAVSAGLLELAKQENVAVFCLSAVTTRGEGNKTPGMHWLRGSGMLEHDPDVILLLHQPVPTDPTRELIVAKARDAHVGRVRLHFSPEILHFVEASSQERDKL